MSPSTTLCVDHTDVLTNKKPILHDVEFLDGATFRPPVTSDRELVEMTLAALSHTDAFGIPEADAHATRKKWKLVEKIPHSSLLQYESHLVTHPTRSENIQLVVGAPRVLMHHATLDSARRYAIEKEITLKTMNGFQVIAIGIKEQMHMSLSRDDVHGISIIGIALLEYKLRDDVQEMLKNLERNTITLRILSEDSLHTCKAIMKLCGLPCLHESCAAGIDIQSMSDSEVTSILPKTNIFAELTPVDHMRLMRLLENNYNVITSTDGVHARQR